jgi:hypothetical protein
MKVEGKELRPPDDPDLALSNLLKELRRAQRNYDEAHAAERTASARTTGCLNELNQLQKRFDSLTDKLREQHPLQTDWGNKRRQTFAA